MKILKIYVNKYVGMLKGALATAKIVGLSRSDKFFIFMDSIYCYLKFCCSFDEYRKYKFYNHKNRYRKNFFLAWHKRNEFNKITDDLRFTRSKYKFHLKIPEYFDREMICTLISGKDGFVEFAKKHKKIIVKPDTGSFGRNIELFSYIDDKQAQNYYDSFSEDMVCEEYIRQHDKMNEINPFSVNTLRVVTFLNNDNVDIIVAVLKTGGAPGNITDNMSGNGIGAQVDVATGIVCTNGFDYKNNTYVKHPVSDVQFMGFNIPNWNKATKLVEEAHKKIPQCKIIGWDIAITQTGADIVEANNAPGTLLMQLGDLKPKGEKVLSVTRKIKKRKHSI